MAYYARHDYTGDGSSNMFAVAFLYLSTTHIEVLVGGVLKTLGIDYSFSNPSVIALSDAPAAGTPVVIKRNTPKGALLVDFQDGSVLTADTIDLANLQTLYITQEQLDDAEHAVEIADRAEEKANAALAAVTGVEPEIGTYALLRAYTGPLTVYYVRGVASLFDGGAGVFRVDTADTTSADNGGTILVDALGRRWKRDFSAGTIEAAWFGLVADGVTDNLAAFQAAHAAFGTTSKGGTIILPGGDLYLSGTWHISKRLVIQGRNQGFQVINAGTRLIFPVNTTGIRIHSSFAGDAPDGNSGANTQIKDVMLCGTVGGTGHGIHASATFYAERVTVLSFGQNGFHIVAGESSLTGNANGFSIKDCRSDGNGGHGYYCDGNDVNAGVIDCLTCSTNGAWGIYDSSFLGNTYIGCRSAGNGVGAYKTDGGAGSHCTFLGCYNETDSANGGIEITPPSVVIGGALATSAHCPILTVVGDGTLAKCTATVTNGVVTAVTVTVQGSGYTTGTISVNHGSGSGAAFTPVFSGGKLVSVTVDSGGSGYASNVQRRANVLGNASSGGLEVGRIAATLTSPVERAGRVTLAEQLSNALVSVQMVGLSQRFDLMRWSESTGCYEMWGTTAAASNTLRVVSEVSTTETGGRSAVLAAGSLVFPRGFWLGSAAAGRQMDNGTAPPTTGEAARGDIRFNTSASASGKAGWICTTTGTNGSTSVWKTWGAIDA